MSLFLSPTFQHSLSPPSQPPCSSKDAVHQAEEAMPSPKLGWGRLQQWRPAGRSMTSSNGDGDTPGNAGEEEDDDDADADAGRYRWFTD